MLQTFNTAAEKRNERIAMIVLIIVVLLKMTGQYFAIDPSFDLQRDEYLHLDQANHLAWGYQSVPPFTSWISYIIKLLGNGIFWVKFFPALFGAATIVTAYQITKSLGGSLYARLLTMAALLFSVLFRINILFQPNSFDIFCWTLVYFFLVKYIDSKKTKWLIWMAVFFALGFLNKYSMLFLAASFTAALLITKERKIFFRKHLYVATIIFLLLILPNIIWQIQNKFPVVHHMKELAATQLVHVSRIDFLKSQLLFFFQALIILIAAAAGFIFYPPFEKYRTIIWSYIICILLFVYFRAKDYYALGLYPVLISFGAVYLGYLLQQGWKRYLRPILLLSIVILFYPYIIRLPLISAEKMATTSPFNKTGPHRWEDGKEYPISQDFADMRGWRELAVKVEKQYRQFPANERVLIFAENYGQAGAINYYKELGAVSFNADYINWIDLSTPIRHMIMIRTAGSEDPATTPLKQLFGSIAVSDSIADTFAREKGTKIYVLKNAVPQLNDVLRKKMEEQHP